MDNIYDIAMSMPRFKKIEVSSVLFTEYKCMDDRSIFAAWAHVNYFVCVFSGQMEWHTTENNYLLRSNDAIFVKRGANIIHKSFEEDFCALMIFIPDEFIRDLIVQAPIKVQSTNEIATESVIPINSDKILGAYFSSLYAYFFSESQPLPYIMEIKFKELVYNLMASHKNSGISSYFKEVAQNRSSSIKYIMEANFTYNLSLGEFARLAHRSLSAFKRDFFDTYRLTPGRWLTDKRLQYSKKLLETTDKKIFEVAFESGFENPSHFTRAFRTKYGLTPLDFKKHSDTRLMTLDV
ncbi:MAG: helix-turn-helix transcriptional regulator [Pricia sp.]|nr:helix-turn-helix transcriptional regulator [Pricia sp.]